MKTKTKEVYYCEYCKKHYLSKYHAKQHEERCSKNPDNWRQCFDCEYCEKKNIQVAHDVDFNDGYGCSNETVFMNVLFCNKKKCGLIPPIAKHRGNSLELADFDNIWMPKKCGDFKEIDYNLF